MHLVIFTLLVGFTWRTWNQYEPPELSAEELQALEDNPEDDPWAGTEGPLSQSDETDQMVAVAIPFFASVAYGGFLTVAYLLPFLGERVSQGMIGSDVEPEEDLFVMAGRAAKEGDVLEAVASYRRAWLANPGDRRAVVEIAKLQRNELKSPAAAVETLREAYDSQTWEEDDAAFLLFRMAEIQEEDLEEPRAVQETLERVTSELEGTRHAANARHRLREMGTK